MKLTNTYQAQLARLGGNTDVTVPAPVNKYEKLLGDIPAPEGGSGSGGGIADHIVHAVLYEEYDQTTDTTSYTVTADMTPGEVAAYQNDGETCVMVLAIDDGGSVSETLVMSAVVNSEFEYINIRISAGGDGSSIMRQVVLSSSDNDDEWQYVVQLGNFDVTLPDEEVPHAY